MRDGKTPGKTPGETSARAERIAGLLLPSIADVLFIALLVGVLFGLGGRSLGYDGDAAWGLRIGNRILDAGLPRGEFMLFPTAGRPIIYFEWLAQVAYALAYRLAGLAGVVALVGALVGTLGAGLFTVLRSRGAGVALAAALTAAGLALTSFTWTARAQLFTLLLALAWAEWLRRYWRDGNARRLWAFPPAMALWANLHGGFITGLALLGTAAAAAWFAPAGRGKANPRHLTLALAATLAATLATPWGLDLPLHVLGYFQNHLIPQVTTEFRSPDFHTLIPQLFLVCLLALAGAWLWLARRGCGIAPLALAHTLVWTVLACFTVRYIAVWAVVVVPILGESLATALEIGPGAAPAGETLSPLRPVLTGLRRAGARIGTAGQRLTAVDARVGRGLWAALALLYVAVGLAHPGLLPGMPAGAASVAFDAQTFPVAAAERLHAAGPPPGNGLTTYTWGSYLDYSLPEFHPFIDSRADVYPESLLRDYLDVTGLAPGWQQTLDRYGIRWALLPPAAPLAQALALLPRWRCAPADDAGVAVLCVR